MFIALKLKFHKISRNIQIYINFLKLNETFFNESFIFKNVSGVFYNFKFVT